MDSIPKTRGKEEYIYTCFNNGICSWKDFTLASTISEYEIGLN